MLEAVIIDNGESSVSALARGLAVPVATGHRQVATLVGEGYLSLVSCGRYVAGPRLLALLHCVDPRQIITRIAAPFLRRAAKELQTVVQLGTFENDMVTYRIKTGQGADELFTRIGMQLEGYCSAIGKVLLAHLPANERTAYLSSGPFVALTQRTIVGPVELATELEEVALQGYAIDTGEIAEDLRCVAVPIRQQNGRVLAAISASQLGPRFRRTDDELLSFLLETAKTIEEAAFSFQQTSRYPGPFCVAPTAHRFHHSARDST